MNQRQVKLLRYLSETDHWMTGKDLAGLLGVSDRTVRSDIAAIGRQTGPAILSSRRYGYRLRAGSPQYPLSPQAKPAGPCPAPTRPGERYGFILKTLLDNEAGLHLQVLKDMLLFSSSSIEKDLMRAKAELKEIPGLCLKRSNSLIWLEGGELAKRRLYQKLVLHRLGGDLLDLDKLAAYFREIDLISMWNEMDRDFRSMGFEVRKMLLPVLITYVGITMKRILGAHFCHSSEYAGAPPENLREKAQYQIAERFFSRARESYGCDAPRDEADILALFLMDRQNLLSEPGDRVNLLVEQVLDQVFQSYEIDLRQDLELIPMLKHHISVLLYQNWIRGFEFPLSGQEIKSNYPLSFEIACFMVHFLEEKTGHTIVETEIGLIALHLQCAYERRYSSEKYRLLIICPYNHGLLSYFLDRMKTHFGQRAQVIDCQPMFERSKVQKEKPDLILTTFPLENTLEIPTLLISLFMNGSDENRIFGALNQLDSQQFRARCIPWMATLSSPSFFYTDLEAKTPEEAICFLCGRLKEAGYIPDAFTDSVLGREQMSSTAFEFQFALPHSLNVSAYHSVLSVAFLKKPIVWGQYKISLVLLPAIGAEDRWGIEIFFNWLGNVITNPGQLHALLESKSWLDFQKLFQ